MAERKVELTSSGWLFNPERLFYIAGQINKDRPPAEKIGLELYPVHYFNGLPMGPGRIDEDKVHGWMKEHGQSPIERIHLPFHWSLPTALKNYFYTSVFKEPGKFSDRAVASGVALMTTTVQNRFALRLANNFDAGLNAHVYIVEEAAKRDKLKMLKDNSRYIWVENDLDYPRRKREQLMRERDPQRAIDAVENHALEGVILGADHDFLYNLNPRETMEANYDGLKKHLRSVHLAGSEGYRGRISTDDAGVMGVVDYVREHGFDNVRFCLDLNPFDMRKMTQDEQVDHIRDVVQMLEAA